MIEVETPDGGVAEFPDGTAPDIIKAALRKKFPAPQTVADGKGDRERSWGETALDAAKSFGTGIEQGAIGLAGMPADIGGMLGDAAGYGMDWLTGASPEQIAANRAKAHGMSGALAPPTSAGLTQAVESVQGPMYQPETTVGKYANAVGQFVPGAAAGPGGLMRKAALAVVPAVASEAAGQATEGTAAEPYARFGAGLLGGFAAGAQPGAAGRAMRGAVGDADAAHAALKAEKNALYGQLRDAGVKYDANAVDQAIADVGAMRLNAHLSPKAVGLREELAKFQGQGMDFQDLDELEKIATGVLRSAADNTEKKFVGDILGKIKTIRERGAIATNGLIPANEVNPVIAKAKDLARRDIIAGQIDEMGRKGKYYVSGTESGARNQFSSYLKSQKGKGLSDAEKEAFDAVTRREGPMNVAHMLGSRFAMPAMGAAGIYTGNIPMSLLGMGANLAFRKGMELSTKKSVDDALKTVLAGRGAQAAASEGKKALTGQRRVQGLLAAEGATVPSRKGAQEPFLIDAQGRPYPYPKRSLLGQ